jgi:hypothetical protein
MGHESFEVRSYTVHLKRGAAREGVPDISAASIHIYEPTPERRRLLNIYFRLDMSRAPENTSTRRPDMLGGYMYVPAEHYPWYIDLLRNEEPVYAMINDDPAFNGLYVLGEEVGEEET